MRSIYVARQLGRRGVTTLALVILTVMAVGGGAVAQQKFQQVEVVNADTDPVPVAGTVDVGNLPATQDVRVTNLPATQNVNVVGGSVSPATTVVDAAFNSGIMNLDEISEQQITLDPPIYATAITVSAPENEESIFRFRATVPGSGGAQCSNTPTNCTVLLMKNVGGTVTQTLPFPTRIDRIHVFCLEAGTFLDDCMPEIVVVGLRL